MLLVKNFGVNMESFFIDKLGNDGDEEKNPNTVFSEDDDPDDFIDEEKLDLYEKLAETLDYKKEKKQQKKECNLNNTYLVTSYTKEKQKEPVSSNVDEILKKSAVPPGLEKQTSVPKSKTKRALKKERKKQREMTKGEKWFNIPATEVTEEIKTDFEVLKMRAVLDKHHVYKKNDITRVPKYFQVGKVVENAADFYSGRIPKSQRKKTMVDELLADAEFKRYQKKKYKEIMDVHRWKNLSKRKKMNEKSKYKT